MNERKTTDRRKIERRAPKAGVNIRIRDDAKEPPKRVRHGRIEREPKP